MTFSLMPPTGSTRPRRLISPVIAVSLLTVRPVNSETRAVNIATPAEGPSFGIAPAGTWTWMSLPRTAWVDPEARRLALDQRQRRLRALAHDLAELAGQDQAALARDAGRLDEQDVAADRRPGQAGRDAGDAGAHRDLALELARPEDLVQVVGVDRHLRRRVPSATFIAALRSAVPISRSRLRTPASRV